MHKTEFTILTLFLIFLSGCSDSSNPPVRGNSFMSWNSDVQSIEIFCGSIEVGAPPKERELYSPEIWRFCDNGWQRINFAEELPKERYMMERDRQSSSLVYLNYVNGETWIWDGKEWTQCADYPSTSNGQINGLMFYNPNNGAVCLDELDTDYTWVLKDKIWVEDKQSNIPSFPFDFSPLLKPLCVKKFDTIFYYGQKLGSGKGIFISYHNNKWQRPKLVEKGIVSHPTEIILSGLLLEVKLNRLLL